jgi:NADPH2:quinone reductase
MHAIVVDELGAPEHLRWRELPDPIPGPGEVLVRTVLVTAYNILMLAGRLRRGETVLVHTAAGGVGSAAVQLARGLGAGRVFATAGGPEKVALARELGADVAIDSRREEFAAVVQRETHGAGVDVILDAVGGSVFEAGLPLLAPFGR